jgi:hypothetical protein
MMGRGYISFEEHSLILEEVRGLRLENQRLKEIINKQDRVIEELTRKSNYATQGRAEKGPNRPPSYSPVSSAKTRSGSVQSRRSQLVVNRSANFTSIEAIDQEILKALELREKAYDEMLDCQWSPGKKERMRSIVERWDIEVEVLKVKRKEMVEAMNEL